MLTVYNPCNNNESLTAFITFNNQTLTLHTASSHSFARACLVFNDTKQLVAREEASISELLHYVYSSWKVPLLVVDRLRHVVRNHR